MACITAVPIIHDLHSLTPDHFWVCTERTGVQNLSEITSQCHILYYTMGYPL